MKEIVLTGLDGSNPLAFFAALGVLEVLFSQGCSARMRWEDTDAWRPIVVGLEAEIEDLVQILQADLKSFATERAILLEYDGKQDLKPRPDVFRRYLEEIVESASPRDRRSVDLSSAFATDVATDNNGNTKPTALHFTAGQQQFLKMVNELISGVTAEDLRQALIGPWRYDRPLPVMGWDATIARDYALRASNPSNDKKLGVPGADWLAFRGLASIPVVPIGSEIVTTGSDGGWKTGSFCWGLWTVALNRDVVRCALRLKLASMPAPERSARGIGVVFRCAIRRSDQGGYGTFTPATTV